MTKYFVSTSGSDSNNGLSLATAFASLRKAAQVLVSGDEVEVGDGTYTNQLAVDINGKSNFKIYAAAGALPRLQYVSTYNGILVKNSDNFSIKGLDLSGWADSIVFADADAAKGSYNATYAANGVFLERCYKVLLQNLTIQSFPGSGITAEECDYTTIERCQVRRCTKYSPYGNQAISFLRAFNSPGAVANTDRLIALRNLCVDNFNLIPWMAWTGGNGQINEGNGIYSDTTERDSAGTTYTGKVKFDDNVCVFNGASGIHILDSAPISITRNFLGGNSRNLTRAELTLLASVSTATGNFIVTDSDRKWLELNNSPSATVTGNTVRGTTLQTVTGSTGATTSPNSFL